MANTSFPSPPSSPVDKPLGSYKRKRLSITLPPIQNIHTKRYKSTAPTLDLQLLKDYLNQGGYPAVENQGRCLLCCACHCQSMEALQLVVNNGLPCQHLCQDDISVLHTAASVGFLPALLFLLDSNNNNMNINGITKQDNHTPLYRAVQANRPEVVAYLLKKGARVDVPDRMGRFPLHIAIMHRHMECVCLLLDYQHLSKNNPSHTDLIWQPKSSISPHLSYDDQSAMEDAVMAGYAPILEKLLQQQQQQISTNGSPLSMEQQQTDLLEAAVHWNRVECLELLLRYGYDVNYKKEKGNTSSLLYKAVQQRKLDMVLLLSKAGAISCYRGWNPCLIYAANHGFMEMIPHLLTSTTSNDCIHQAVTLATPLNKRQQLLSIIIHTLKTAYTYNNTTFPITPISP
ncbi:ankyrin repeat-containing domain protein [Halteromyces radiatus]|uniref:ankyrin repeat-containing domain protein n=1 Tax=Halteromyces radiatus TaxID=101107 RepID=UPI00221FD653|nr:ankyrin repeat-containing domain protein [Halteromyces radiatus]KAI8076856.1 ankyrin repeat-containing domain protein [Halteromyces radiatus]